MLHSSYVLIIANSARYLAQAATINAFKPLVIDVFADSDTQQYAVEYKKLNSLSLAEIIPAVTYFKQRYAVVFCLYGSGFENFGDSLYYLHQHFLLLGNDAETFNTVQDKTRFFSLLTALSIPYPETRFSPPDNMANWLIKPLRGQGGMGITPYHPRQNIIASYWQRQQIGSVHSVLFLADAKDSRVIGFNTQWSINLGNGQEFMFSGIINSSLLTEEHKHTVLTWLKRLIPALKLMGLNTLDFIYHNNTCYCLEINPRLSASVQLYSPDILLAHCHNSLDYSVIPPHYCAYYIIYAPQDIIIPAHINWTDNCVDIPSAGVCCRTRQPICSIIASGSSVQAVFERVQQQQQFIFSQLFRGSAWQTEQASINFPSI